MVSISSHSAKFGQRLVGEIGHIYEGCSEHNAPYFFSLQNKDSNVKIER